MWLVYDKKCAYTSTRIELREVEIDHIIPIYLADSGRTAEVNAVLDYWGLPAGFNLESYLNKVPTHGEYNKAKGKDPYHHEIGMALRFAQQNHEQVLKKLEKLKFDAKIRKLFPQYGDFSDQEYFSEDVIYISRSSIYLNCLLPQFPEFNGSLLLTFKSLTISHCQITFNQREILSNLFFNTNADPTLKSRNFIVGFDEKKEICWVQLGNNRFPLPIEDARQLCEIIDKLAPYYIAALKREETEVFKSLDFKRVKIGEYKLIEIDRWLWRDILSFAHEYDYENGTSAWHIFDSNNAYLKVYCKSPNDKNRHHRLVIFPRASDEHADLRLSNDRVVLVWGKETIEYYAVARSGSADDFVKRKSLVNLGIVWDAAKAFDWLINFLVPKVLEWKYQKTQTKKSSLFWFNPKQSPQMFVEPYIYKFRDRSEANQIDPNILTRISDLIEAVTKLQSFIQFTDSFIYQTKPPPKSTNF